MNTIRRFWFYAVTLVALGIFAAGVERFIEPHFSDYQIKGAQLVQVGGPNFNQTQLKPRVGDDSHRPVLCGCSSGWPCSARVRGNQEEPAPVMRKFFLNFVLLVSAFMLIINASGFLSG